jgi:hypothetical protein
MIMQRHDRHADMLYRYPTHCRNMGLFQGSHQMTKELHILHVEAAFFTQTQPAAAKNIL